MASDHQIGSRASSYERSGPTVFVSDGISIVDPSSADLATFSPVFVTMAYVEDSGALSCAISD